jgi:hypothetical protein
MRCRNSCPLRVNGKHLQRTGSRLRWAGRGHMSARRKVFLHRFHQIRGLVVSLHVTGLFRKYRGAEIRK